MAIATAATREMRVTTARSTAIVVPTALKQKLR
jgi:hypothetical protein